MSTVTELLDELKNIKDKLRESINTAWGKEVITEDDCFDRYPDLIEGLCPCGNFCARFIYGEQDEEVIEICDIKRGGCLFAEQIPLQPEYPEYDEKGYTWMGWADENGAIINYEDICDVNNDLVFHGIYFKGDCPCDPDPEPTEEQYIISVDYDNCEIIIN